MHRSRLWCLQYIVGYVYWDRLICAISFSDTECKNCRWQVISSLANILISLYVCVIFFFYNPFFILFFHFSIHFYVSLWYGCIWYSILYRICGISHPPMNLSHIICQFLLMARMRWLWHTESESIHANTSTQ